MSEEWLVPATLEDSSTEEIERLVIISNRLPFTLSDKEGISKISSSSGGLVTAMGPVLRHRGGVWIGWPGVLGHPAKWSLLKRHTKNIGYLVNPVFLTEEEFQLFYQGFSNGIIWPLFHCMPHRCDFNPTYWRSYQEVNKKFAHVVKSTVQKKDLLWTNDYHLIQLGQRLRELGVENPSCFFLHIPFPPDRIFVMMPWAREILISMLSYNLLGFQTPWHKTHFMRAVESLLKKIHISRHGSLHHIEHKHGVTKVGSFPIGIDYQHFATTVNSSKSQGYSQTLCNSLKDTKIVLGIDRMDYTKGIRHKLRGFSDMLKKYQNLIGKVTLVQVLVPSREQIPEYEKIKQEIEQLVGKINGEFSRPNWTPIIYQYRSLKHEELLGYYHAADIALITPLDDGMNLVAKEFCACAKTENSVLVLSKFAGAAAQLGKYALTVNPFDTEGMADTIYHACTMQKEERIHNMNQLKKTVANHNVFHWVDSFLQAAQAGYLDKYPQQLPDTDEKKYPLWWK